MGVLKRDKEVHSNTRVAYSNTIRKRITTQESIFENDNGVEWLCNHYIVAIPYLDALNTVYVRSLRYFYTAKKYDQKALDPFRFQEHIYDILNAYLCSFKGELRSHEICPFYES